MSEKEIVVAPTLEAMSEVQSMIEVMMDEEGIPMKIAFKMNIVIDEIFSNIVSYSGAGKARVNCRIGDGRIELLFYDDGIPYNPLETREPDVTLSPEERGIGGLGIMITKKMMDEVLYQYADGQNQLLCRKNF